jgi:hypothetical protein
MFVAAAIPRLWLGEYWRRAGAPGGDGERNWLGTTDGKTPRDLECEVGWL